MIIILVLSQQMAETNANNCSGFFKPCAIILEQYYNIDKERDTEGVVKMATVAEISTSISSLSLMEQKQLKTVLNIYIFINKRIVLCNETIQYRNTGGTINGNNDG